MRPYELKGRLSGVAAFAVTPFADDLSVDFAGLRRNVRFLLEKGIHIIVTCGGTGEFFSLTLDEHERVVQTVVDEISGRIPVIAGVGYGTKVACDMARRLEKAGADGLMVVSPYYLSPSEEGMYLHYSALAASVGVGLIIYTRYDAVYSPNLVARLAELPTVIGYKDEYGDLSLFLETKRRIGERLAWISSRGAEALAPAYFACGATCFASGIANFAPILSLDVYRALAGADYKGALRLVDRKIAPVTELRERKKGYHVSVVKAAMDMLGLTGGRVRPPLFEIDLSERRELEQLLKRLDLLPSA